MTKSVRAPYPHEVHGYIGVDECGIGAWAGPAVVCATYIPHTDFQGLADSKAYKSNGGKQHRSAVSSMLLGTPGVVFCVSLIHHLWIDTIGLGPAQDQAVARCVRMVRSVHDLPVVVDGCKVAPGIDRIFPVVKADVTYPAVSAASVIAKEYRDGVMRRLAKEYVHWDFAGNVGYHSARHVRGLKEFGVSAIHRRSVRPIQLLLSESPVVG